MRDGSYKVSAEYKAHVVSARDTHGMRKAVTAFDVAVDRPARGASTSRFNFRRAAKHEGYFENDIDMREEADRNT